MTIRSTKVLVASCVGFAIGLVGLVGPTPITSAAGPNALLH